MLIRIIRVVEMRDDAWIIRHKQTVLSTLQSRE